MIESPTFIQARNYTVCVNRTVKWLGVHTTQNEKRPGIALANAKLFASSASPIASFHYCVDNISIVQSVAECDIAWAAPGANLNGIHIEHGCKAEQSVEEWADAYCNDMLNFSSTLAASICARYSIPIIRLTVTDLLAGKPGIVGHKEISLAFKKSDHVDPGENFPWDKYLTMIKEKVINHPQG